MIDMLTNHLDQVVRRAGYFRSLRATTVLWLVAAFAGVVLFAVKDALGLTPSEACRWLVSVSLGANVFVYTIARLRSPNRLEIARMVEAKFPELNDRLLTALEQQPDLQTGGFSFLQNQVIKEVLDHGANHSWGHAVAPGKLARAACWNVACLMIFLAVNGAFLQFGDSYQFDAANFALTKREATGPEALSYGITVEPGDTSIERGTSLLVLARFANSLPSSAILVVSIEDAEKRIALTKSLDDPVFGGRIPGIQMEGKYCVEYDDQRTKDFTVKVFDYPRLQQADATIHHPSYANREDKVIQDTQSVTAVEGSQVTWACHFNKPVAAADLVSESNEHLELVPADADPLKPLEGDDVLSEVFVVKLTPKESGRYKLIVIDDEGRENKNPPELVMNVINNRPPELKIASPKKDLRVSPLEEVELAASAWDDFGLTGFGVIYSLAEKEPQTINMTVGEEEAAEESIMNHLLSFESLDAKPDQLLSYYFFADDIGPNGESRRTFSDMFFAEVRHFEEIFRQGQSPQGQQQQQQQQSPAGSNAQKAEELMTLQKQIIMATWKVIRREISETPTSEFEPDTKLLVESQQAALKKAEELAEKLQDAKSKGFIATVTEHMDRAIEQLLVAHDNSKIASLPPALQAEQAAFQALLKLKAREHKVMQQRQSSSSSSQSRSQSSRSQQQLQQLQLDNKKNRYESQQSAQKKAPPANKEQLQILNRLRELSRRQGDLNRRLKELENALREAKNEEQREELKRRLKRLREEQQELLRDVDKLRNRMDQPQNQREMTESKKQLDQTREQVRQASEKLEKGQVSKALNSGTRAERDLQKLRDDFRKQTAGQFAEAMKDLRNEARELAENQEDLSKKLNQKDQPKTAGLRRKNTREEVEKGLKEQDENLEDILDRMQNIVQEAEKSEPLLANQLYDTIRDSRKNKPREALKLTNEFLRRGLVDEAKQTEKLAGQGIDEVRKGIEKAAKAVLGSELEALRRAQQELKDLSKDVGREIAQADPKQRNDQRVNQALNPDGQERQPDGKNGQPQKNQGQQPGDSKGDPQKDQDNKENQQGTSPGQKPGDQKAKPGEQPNSKSNQSNKPGQQPQDSKQPGQGMPNQDGKPQQDGKSSQDGKPGEGKPQNQGKPSQQGKPQDGKSPNGSPQNGKPKQGSPQQGTPQQDGSPQKGNSNQPGQQPQQRKPNQEGKPGQQPQLAQGQPQQQPGQRGSKSQSQQQQSFFENGFTGGEGGPLTGANYQEWSDRMRELEETVDDPKLRADIARVRDRVKGMRIEFKRHSKEPKWDLVKMDVLQPMLELQKRLAEEIAKRSSNESLVPIDRDPVPARFAQQVEEYYERLGSGK
ncbi:MAG: hypothetical protein CMJ78_07775 [Planctomycetaceae bacterium]|nr:hypothetical protein [Planctomycetaceae bacterium]